MSLRDEINTIRSSREVEQEARLAKEREEALAQLTPETIARKLIELRAAKPELVGVSQLLAVNTPGLISEVAAYLQQQGNFIALKFDPYKRRIEERDIPTVEIEGWTEEGKDGLRSLVRVRCEQERRERPLRIGGFSDIGDGPIYSLGKIGIEVETRLEQGPLKMYVSGGGIHSKELKEPTEESLRELIVTVLAGLKA